MSSFFFDRSPSRREVPILKPQEPQKDKELEGKILKLAREVLELARRVSEMEKDLSMHEITARVEELENHRAGSSEERDKFLLALGKQAGSYRDIQEKLLVIMERLDVLEEEKVDKPPLVEPLEVDLSGVLEMKEEPELPAENELVEEEEPKKGWFKRIVRK